MFGVVSLIWLTLALVDSEDPVSMHLERQGVLCAQKTGRRAWNEHGNWRLLLYRLQYLNLQPFLGKAIADGLFFQFSELVEDLHVLAGLQKLAKIFEIGRCLSGIWLAA